MLEINIVIFKLWDIKRFCSIRDFDTQNSLECGRLYSKLQMLTTGVMRSVIFPAKIWLGFEVLFVLILFFFLEEEHYFCSKVWGLSKVVKHSGSILRNFEVLKTSHYEINMRL